MIRPTVAALILVLFHTNAQSAISLSLAQGSQISGPLIVGVGREVEIPIFLNQSFPLDNNEPDLSTDALFSFGFSGAVDGANAEITAFSISGPFIDAGPSDQPLPGSSVQLAGLTFSGATGSSIQLGSITLRPLRAGDFALTLSDTDNRVDDFVTDSGAVLDSLLFPDVRGNQTLFSISAIPEPSSMLALMLGSCACVMMCRRSRSANLRRT